MTNFVLPSETLADRVRRLRLSRHMSRPEFAQVAGVSRSHVHQIETGQRTRMRLATLAKYATALGVPEGYIDYGSKLDRTIIKERQTDLMETLRQSTRLEDDQIQQVVGLIHALEAERERRSLIGQRPTSAKEMQPA